MSLGNRRCCINNVFKNSIGDQGSTGAYGPIGPMGITGNTGSFGYIGATGICYKGYNGSAGFTGAQGGITGPVGPVGSIGTVGTQLSKNISFTFTTQSLSSYNSSSFTNITNLSSSTISNSIYLDTGNYSIKYEIYENWTDPYSKFYIGFKNGITNVYPYVFDPNNTSYLAFNTDGVNLYGVGNDKLIITTPDTYTIELFQSTNSSSTILIPNKTITFSISFITNS